MPNHVSHGVSRDTVDSYLLASTASPYDLAFLSTCHKTDKSTQGVYISAKTIISNITFRYSNKKSLDPDGDPHHHES